MLNRDEHLEIDLLDNGIDFILRGIDELFDQQFEIAEDISPLDIGYKNYKYGILHLFSGFLLILKERLYRHDPGLIFRDTLLQASRKGPPIRRPLTIDLKESIKRLDVNLQVVFADEEKEIIAQIQDYRNQLEHYKISVARYELWWATTCFLDIIDKFLVDELQISLEEHPDASDLSDKIHKISSVWQRDNKKRKEAWYNDAKVRYKMFRKNRKNILSELDFARYREKMDVYITCPECDRDTLVAYGEYAGICANKQCGSLYPIASCDRCGQLTTGFSWELNFCDYCKEDIYSDD